MSEPSEARQPARAREAERERLRDEAERNRHRRSDSIGDSDAMVAPSLERAQPPSQHPSFGAMQANAAAASNAAVAASASVATPAASSGADTVTFEESLPLRLWGVDPVFWSSVKLRVSDVFSLPCYPGLPDSFRLGSHPVTKVELVGVVVAVLQRGAFVSYSVDDGTGVIHCTCWFNNNAVGSSALSPSHTLFFRQAPRAAGGFASSPFNILAIGNVVRVRGQVKLYLQQRQITAESVFVETDPNAETLHWLECMQLKKNVYSQPSQVILESAALGQAARLAEACRNWLRESHLSSFTVAQLLQQGELREAASQSLVTSPSSSSSSSSPPPPAADSSEQHMHAAVQYLFRMGIILRPKSDVDTYELTSLERHIAPLVFRIIANGPSGTGVHRDAIVSAVHARHPHVLQRDILDSISILEEQSDISAWDTPLTYASCNPAAADGVEPLHFRPRPAVQRR